MNPHRSQGQGRAATSCLAQPITQGRREATPLELGACAAAFLPRLLALPLLPALSLPGSSGRARACGQTDLVRYSSFIFHRAGKRTKHGQFGTITDVEEG